MYQLPGVKILNCRESIQALGLFHVTPGAVYPAKAYDFLWSKYRIITAVIKRDDYQGLRITPNVYTTLDEIDTFAGAIEDLLKHGAPNTAADSTKQLRRPTWRGPAARARSRVRRRPPGRRCPRAVGFGGSDTEDPSADGVGRDSVRCRTSAAHVARTAPDSEPEHLDIDSRSAPPCR